LYRNQKIDKLHYPVLYIKPEMAYFSGI